MSEDTSVAVKFIVPFPQVTPPALNIDEMKAAATAFSKKYTGLVVTRENFADSRVSCAEQKKVIDGLTAMKTALNKKAKEIIAPCIAGIDEVLAIVKPPYQELHDGLVAVKDEMDKEKHDGMMAYVQEVSSSRFPELSAAMSHLKSFVSSNCVLKKGGWLTKSWTLPAIRDEIDKEADRMCKAMEFINSHVKGRQTDVVRVAKTALVNNGFNEVVALEAMDKYEKTLVEQKRMADVKAGRDPDAAKPKPAPAPTPAPAPASVPVSDPITSNSRVMTATVKFIAPVDEMKKLVAVIKTSGIHYEVIEQKFVKE